MPYLTCIDEEGKRAVVELSGVVTSDDLINAMTDLFNHPGWQPSFDSLWDGRLIKQLDIGPGQVGKISRTIGSFSAKRGPGKGAVVVARDIDYAIGKFFSLIARRPTRPVELFWSIDKALEWLADPSV